MIGRHPFSLRFENELAKESKLKVNTPEYTCLPRAISIERLHDIFIFDTLVALVVRVRVQDKLKPEA